MDLVGDAANDVELINYPIRFIESFCNKISALNQALRDNILVFGSDEEESFVSLRDDCVTHDRVKIILVNAIDSYLQFHDLLRPWKDPATQNNRHYFCAQGGPKVFLQIMQLVRKYHMMEHTFTEQEQVALIRFRCVCLEILWNSSETKADREHWIKLGIVETALEYFLDSEIVGLFHLSHTHQIGYNPMYQLSIGIIVQYMEYEEARLNVAQHKPFMRLYVTKLEHLPLPTQPGFALYYEQMMYNTAMCILASPATHHYLVEHELHTVLAALSTRLTSDNCYTTNAGTLDHYRDNSAYFACMGLSYLLAFSPDLLACCPPEPKKRKLHLKIGDMFRAKQEHICFFHLTETSVCNFVQTYSPVVQHNFEKSKGYVWVTMSPFLELAWCWKREGCCRLTPDACYKYVLYDPSYKTLYQEDRFSVPQSMGLWGLSAVLMDPLNQEVIYREGLQDFVVMLGWCFPGLKCAQEFSEESACVPTLYNICVANLLIRGLLTPHLAFHGTTQEISNLAVKNMEAKELSRKG